MPIIKTHENKVYTSLTMINKIIYPNVVSLFELTESMINLAKSSIFTDELKQNLLSSLPDNLIKEYREINLTHSSLFIARPDFKQELDKKLKEYQQIHSNNCDEIQHVINGSVMFGFVDIHEKQSCLLLLPGEKLFIKENSEHWGTVTDDYYATLITCRSVAYSNLFTRQTNTPVLVKL